MAKRGKPKKTKRPSAPAPPPKPQTLPQMPKRVLERTNLEFYVGIILGIVVGVVPMNAIIRCILLLLVLGLLIHVCWRASWMINRKRYVKMVATAILVVTYAVVAVVLLTTTPARPKFKLYLGKMLAVYNESLQKTKLLIEVAITNSGEPSITREWKVHYQSPTLDTFLHPARFLDENKPEVFPMADNPKVGDSGIEFDTSKAINNTTATSPIMRGVPAHGRLLVYVPGDRRSEISSGKALIKVILRDYLRDRDYEGKFQTGGGDKIKNLDILPSDKIVPLPTQTPTQKKN